MRPSSTRYLRPVSASPSQERSAPTNVTRAKLTLGCTADHADQDFCALLVRMQARLDTAATMRMTGGEKERCLRDELKPHGRHVELWSSPGKVEPMTRSLKPWAMPTEAPRIAS